MSRSTSALRHKCPNSLSYLLSSSPRQPLSLPSYLLKADSLPSSLTQTHCYICISCTGTHTLAFTSHSCKDTTFFNCRSTVCQTHVHTDPRKHTAVCVFFLMVFQWGVSLGGCWSAWCYLLKASKWLNAGIPRRVGKQGKPRHRWVRRKGFTSIWLFFSIG